MVTIVFALAIANLGLGFALAVALDRFPVLSMQSLRRPSAVAVETDLENHGTHDNSCVDDEGNDWVRTLKAAKIDPKSAIETMLWIIKLEATGLRTRIVAIDQACYDQESPQSIATELKQEVDELHQSLESWIAHIDAESDLDGPQRDALEELLLDQTFQLRGCMEGLVDPSANEERRHLATTMTVVNVLRDRVDALIGELLTDEDRLHSVQNRYRTFGEQDTLTHLGLAALFDEWWADDPDHVRLVSVVMLDVDRFDAFTQKVGSSHGDVALLRFGTMLHDLVRKDRGFDRVARYSGQRFVMFLGDTSAKNASKGAERVRQAIEATSFKLGEESFELTASLAVVEVGGKETPRDFIARLEAALDECKKAGRNCGFVDAGEGPTPIKLPRYDVEPHSIQLDEDSLTQAAS